jgi:glutamyl-tRNA reductase
VNLLVVGGSYKTAPIEVREKLAFDGPKLTAALRELESRFGIEASILSTCNRVELYLARGDDQPLPAAELIVEFIAEMQKLPVESLTEHLYNRSRTDAIRHLFRVAASLDSLVVGEGQISGQVRRCHELAREQATVGPALNALFRQASVVAKRVRTDTGISRGHVSVSSVAVDYVRQVFDRFDDKTILVIGAGKMGELTLRHLRGLEPRRILVTNRNPEKATAVAQGCGGEATAWEKLDDALAVADIVLSTTGATEPIMTRRRFDDILARRSGGPMVILDIAVPRDFDPRIHDGDRACLFNIDDLQRIRSETLAERQRHVAPAEAIVEAEVKRFESEWKRRRNGPVVAKLIQGADAVRQPIVGQVLGKLNGRLSGEDIAYIEKAFRLFQNKLLHGPISALSEELTETKHHTLRDALHKLFGLGE